MQAAAPLPVADNRLQLAVGRVGQLIRDRWHLDVVLGVGGSAAVYAATHRNNGKRVALKILHPELSAIPEIRQRFLDEGYAANCVAHPGAVSVIDDDLTEDGHVFLIMDLLVGETLDQYVGEVGCLPPDRVLVIADAVLDILAAAHEKGIVHRDVKPDNIFIERDGTVRLLDFGIARLTSVGHKHTTPNGPLLGTPGFMPPEQARGNLELLDARTDLWALGATMYFLLTGRDVHEAGTLAEELIAAMTKPVPSIAEVAPHLPAPLIGVIDRALAFEQNSRWCNAREMQAAVRRCESIAANPVVSSVREGSCRPATPTLVTPTLARLTARPGPRARAASPVMVIVASAAAVFLALVAARRVSRSFPATLAPAMAMREPHPVTSEVAGDEPKEAIETAPPSPATTSPSSPPTFAVTKGKVVRPNVLPHVVEEARTWAASGIRSSADGHPADRQRAKAASDPLDRRK